MTTYFVDTSALGRRYLQEIGSTWLLSWILLRAGNVVILSELTTVELISTFARWNRQGNLNLNNIARLTANFLFHVDMEYVTVLVDTPIIIQARTLVAKYKLRTLDALQLACAMDAVNMLNEQMIFISGDKDLLIAAAGEGFQTDNPYLHP